MTRDEQIIYYDMPESYKSPSTSLNLSPSPSYWELKQANMALQPPPQLTHETLMSNLNNQDFRASPLDPNYDTVGSLMEPSSGPEVDNVYRQQYSISRDGTKIFPSVSPPYRYSRTTHCIFFIRNHFSTVAGQWGDYDGGNYYTNAGDYYSRLLR